jgi:hypothetical protein
MGLDAAIYGKDDRTLATKRIGNVAHVAFLRDLATRCLGSTSLVVSKVLYSGTHSGDSIAVADLEPLSRELQVLERASDAEMQAFALDMLEMVNTALQYEKPICFT